jgi:hypothetical protein
MGRYGLITNGCYRMTRVAVNQGRIYLLKQTSTPDLWAGSRVVSGKIRSDVRHQLHSALDPLWIMAACCRTLP